MVSDHQVDLPPILMPEAVSMFLVLANPEAEFPECGLCLQQTCSIRPVIRQHVDIVGWTIHHDACPSGVGVNHQPADEGPPCGNTVPY